MLIVKVGGGASINLEGIASDLAATDRACVVVHGANALRDELAERLGCPTRTLTSVSGHSSVWSDDRAIDVQMMAYAGVRNKRLVEALQRRGVNAVGLSGLDGRLISGRRNRGIRVREEGKLRIVHDCSGKPRSVNLDLLQLLLDHAYLPVLTVPIADETGQAINSENDEVVAVLQAALGAEQVVHLVEAPGLLQSRDDPASLLRRLSRADLAAHEERAPGRMKRKLHAIRKLFDAGVASVIIADGRVEQPLRQALAGGGTTIL